MTATDDAGVAATGFAPRFEWHLSLAWRASRFGIVLAAVGAFLLRLVLPVRGGWLAGLVAASAAAVALLCMGVARRDIPLPPTRLDVGAQLEKVGAADQVAHGLVRAAFVLGAFWLGLTAGGLAAALRA